MDFQKLDASLISAMGESEVSALSKLPVFVRFNPQSEPEEATLAELLGPAYSTGQTVITASLTRPQIASLSLHPGVTSIRLSRQLRPLSSDSPLVS